MHAADKVPGRVPAFQEVRYSTFRFRQLDPECRVQFLPESLQDLRRQILGASHGRRSQREPVQLCDGWGGDGRFLLRRLGIRLCTEGGDVPCAEFSPVGKNRRKRGSHFVRSEVEKTMARSTLEGVEQAPTEFGIKIRSVRRRD